jgi:methylated-DNA-protein-cysteine methyltransferase-like protein
LVETQDVDILLIDQQQASSAADYASSPPASKRGEAHGNANDRFLSDMTHRQRSEQTATAQHPASPLAARREALYIALAQVPVGKVVSYGQLAELAGLGRAARWVGRTLSQLPQDTTLPWHRVIAASGHLSLPAGSVAGAEQRARLRAEGLLIDKERVDIRRHGWRPMEHSG